MPLPVRSPCAWESLRSSCWWGSCSHRPHPPDGPPALFWLLVVAVLAALAWLVVSLVQATRRTTPTSGRPVDPQGLDLVDAPRREREVRTDVPVEDANRRQPAIEFARPTAARQDAVLVPREPWLSLVPRRRAAGRRRPASARRFLGSAAQERWVDLLDGLCQQGGYVRVPAMIVGAARPFRVELDLSGLPGLEGLDATEAPGAPGD